MFDWALDTPLVSYVETLLLILREVYIENTRKPSCFFEFQKIGIHKIWARLLMKNKVIIRLKS